MGGGGSFVAHNGSVGGAGRIFLPSGKGGGCIMDGPFQGIETHLDPNSPKMAGEVKVNSTFVYNQRCLQRDLTNYASSNRLTTDNSYNLTLGPAAKNIATFQNQLQGRFYQGFLGLHAAGHFSIGGDAGDFFSSPNDPVFFMHHAMTIAGTVTLFNSPPSRDAVLDGIVQGRWLDLDPRTNGDLLEPLDDTPFCYIYL
ncbi:hypothetical protein E8E11_005910 [Didymella keratinophila]|nr:hypothetical protein E8E11_005910 [Didymella keratinophila]